MTNTTDKVLYLELIDKQNSGFVQEGSQEAGNPVYMDSPDRRRILGRSHIINEKGEVVYIRYIAGCDTIFEEEQIKRNIKPNPAKDIIWFEGSQTKTVKNEGMQKPLFQYLSICPFNINAPNRPSEIEPIFREIHAEKVAEKDLSSLMQEREISNVIGELYEKQGDSFVYNEEKINYYMTLLAINPSESPSVNLIAIDTQAKSDPAKFLSTIAGKNKSYRIEIMEAISQDVIDLKGDKAVWVEGQMVFTKSLRVKSQDEKIDVLIRYFLTPEGAEDYKTMMTRLTFAREKALESK